MPPNAPSTRAHHQEVKIALHTYRCDDTRDCAMQFRPPDDKHMRPDDKHMRPDDKHIRE